MRKATPWMHSCHMAALRQHIQGRNQQCRTDGFLTHPTVCTPTWRARSDAQVGQLCGPRRGCTTRAARYGAAGLRGQVLGPSAVSQNPNLVATDLWATNIGSMRLLKAEHGRIADERSQGVCANGSIGRAKCRASEAAEGQDPGGLERRGESAEEEGARGRGCFGMERISWGARNRGRDSGSKNCGFVRIHGMQSISNEGWKDR